MKKRLLFLFVVVFCCAGCGKNEEMVDSITETKNETNVEAVIYSNGQGFSKEGITYVEDSIIQYIDFASGECFPLCSRLNCPHRRLTAEEIENGLEPCMAYLEGVYQAVVYQEKLYAFATKDGGGIYIYASDMDGANRKVLAQLPEASIHNGIGAQFYEDKLVLLTMCFSDVRGEEPILSADMVTGLFCVELDSGKVTECLQEWSGTTKLLYVDAEGALVSVEYIKEEVYERWTEEERLATPNLVRDYKYTTLWSVSFADGSATELEKGKLDGWNVLKGANREGALVVRVKENMENELYYLSFTTGKETPLPLSDVMVLDMKKEGALLVQSVKQEGKMVNQVYEFTIAQQEAKLLSTNLEKRPVQLMGGNVYCEGDGGNHIVVSLEDFLAGNTKVLYEMETSIYAIIR